MGSQRVIGLTAYGEMVWKPTMAELSTVAERLEELAEWALEEAEAPAVAHKLQEALGPLRNAIEAAAQHRVGLLPEPKPIEPKEVTCPVCPAKIGAPCVVDPDRRFSTRLTYYKGVEDLHEVRIHAATDFTNKRRDDLLQQATALIDTL